MHTQRDEIDRNFVAFRSAVATLMDDHEGHYALMRHGQVIHVYEKLVDAVTAGHGSFSDGIFSIQEVTMSPLDLGFYSHANSLG